MKTTLRISAVLLLVVGAVAGPSKAQFGRWSWDGYVGIGQRNTENQVASETTSEFDLDELRLALALNGFLGHPALGRFRLGVDTLVSKQEGGFDLDSDALGLEATVDFLPQGAYPSRLFFRRRTFDHTFDETTDARLIRTLPETSTRWGGHLRVRRGPLSGLALGLESLDQDFQDEESDPQTEDRHWLEWAHSGKALQQRVRLEQRQTDYGFIDLEIDDLTLNIDERLTVEDRWRWLLSGVGIARDVRTATSELSTDDFRLRNRFTFFVRERDQLDIRTASGWLSREGEGSITDHGATVAYRWRVSPVWEIAPFAQYSRQSGAELTLISPRLGVAVTWSHSRERWDGLVTARISYGEIEGRRNGNKATEDEEGYGFTATFGHGQLAGLRKEIEVEYTRNDLGLTRGPLVDLTDLGFSLEQLGTDDLYRGRLTLGHRWDGRVIDAWAEWRRRESSGTLRLGDFQVEGLTGNLQLSGRRFNVQVNIGETEVERETRPPELIDFRGLGVSLFPLRALSLRASFRDDRRELVLTPDLETEQFRFEVRYQLGQIILEGEVFKTEQRILGSSDRTNRGFRWTVSRRLSGLLPIITGTERRGEIR